MACFQRNVVLATRLAQRLRLNRRAIHLSSSTEINQITSTCAVLLSQAYAVMGEKDLALKAAERAIMLLPSAKDPGGRTWPMKRTWGSFRPSCGENSSAISTLTRLLQTPYESWGLRDLTPVTPALLRLDPIWDPLRGDPAFQKLCEEKEK